MPFNQQERIMLSVYGQLTFVIDGFINKIKAYYFIPTRHISIAVVIVVVAFCPVSRSWGRRNYLGDLDTVDNSIGMNNCSSFGLEISYHIVQLSDGTLNSALNFRINFRVYGNGSSFVIEYYILFKVYGKNTHSRSFGLFTSSETAHQIIKDVMPRIINQGREYSLNIETKRLDLVHLRHQKLNVVDVDHVVDWVNHMLKF